MHDSLLGAVHERAADRGRQGGVVLMRGIVALQEGHLRSASAPESIIGSIDSLLSTPDGPLCSIPCRL